MCFRVIGIQSADGVFIAIKGASICNLSCTYRFPFYKVAFAYLTFINCVKNALVHGNVVHEFCIDRCILFHAFKRTIHQTCKPIKFFSATNLIWVFCAAITSRYF